MHLRGGAQFSHLPRPTRPGLDSRLETGGATPPGAERGGQRGPGLPIIIAPTRGEAQASHAASLQLSSPRWYFPLCHPRLSGAAPSCPARWVGGWAEVERSAPLPKGLKEAALVPPRWHIGPSPPTGAGDGWWCSQRSSSRRWCSGCSVPSASSLWNLWRRLKNRPRESPGSPP